MPFQWVETDKNEHMKGQPGYKRKCKSRLVGCGQFENCPEARKDSPTCDVEGLNLLMAWTALNANLLCCADIKNAYFNSDPVDRVQLFKPPSTGLPGETDCDKFLIASVRPIYGTGDSGRRFYLTFRRKATSRGWHECRIMRSLHAWRMIKERSLR